MNDRGLIAAAVVSCALLMTHGAGLPRGERQYIWPDGRMPDAQPQLIAAMTEDSRADGFKADDWRRPYVEWFAAPPEGRRTGVCVILISGGSYECCCDGWLLKDWLAYLTKLGVTCVNFVHRTPRANGLPFYQVAWEDGQRAVRVVRQAAAARGFDPAKIGVMSMSAGSHLATLLATTSLTPAYAPVDELDNQPCHIDFAITSAIAYGMTDGLGIWNMRGGDGPDITLDRVFAFDAKTAPMCMFHGGLDRYSALTSTFVYRRLRAMGVAAELHLFADRPHCFFGDRPGRKDSASYDNWLDRAAEFMRQMKFLSPLGTPVDLTSRFPDDDARGGYARETIWPSGKTPDAQANQGEPCLEWHLPRTCRTAAIQIVCMGGGSDGTRADGFEAASVRRYLNAKGMTVVELTSRTSPSQAGIPRYVPAWQDLQRAVRLVRRGASAKGLDPNAIGVMGAFAGGHLALLGATASRHAAYYPVDDVDKLSCKVQWAVIVSPVSVLASGGADPAWRFSEFPFDPDTPPMLFVTGDSATCPALASVMCWEHLRRIGLQSDLHVLELPAQGFPYRAAPGTGGFTWLDRIWEFMNHRAISRDPPRRPTVSSDGGSQ